MNKRKFIALAAVLFLAFSMLVACVPENNNEDDNGGSENKTADGTYVLTQKTVAGKDVTDNYLCNVLQLSDGAVLWYETDISGREVNEGTFTEQENFVTVRIGLRAYEFAYDKTAGTLSFSGKISKKAVTMRYKSDKNYSAGSDSGSVKFTDELFGESADENFYNYCPSVIQESNDTMHIWYCSNAESGMVTDYVAYRKGTLHSDGKWTFSDKKIVLEPTTGTWDSRHTCDPSVVKGNFVYGGKSYSWLMAYLGCKTSDNSRNEVGIALAQNPDGPWIKPEAINPIADFYNNENEYNASSWGYGQPSLINIDKDGKVILFYSKGITQGTYTYAELWDLTNVSSAHKIKEGMVSNIGVTNASGQIDVINNADFAYDPVTKRLYSVKEDFPYPTNGNLNWITGSNTVMYLELSGDETSPLDTLFTDSSARWTVFDKITESRTNYPRNHNCGIVTDAYGWVRNPVSLPIVYTMSLLATSFPNWNAGGQWPALHTYRLHGTLVDL